MANMWTESKREKLIELVRNEESIWRKASKNHRRTDSDQIKWQAIASELGITVDEAQKEWNVLKKSFYYQKNLKAPSGSEGGNRKYKSKNSIFFQQLSFLQDNLRGRRQIDTMRNEVLTPPAPDFESDIHFSAYDPLTSSMCGENIHNEGNEGDTEIVPATLQVIQTIPRQTESLQRDFGNTEASQDIAVLLREADELCNISIVSSPSRDSEEVPRQAETFERHSRLDNIPRNTRELHQPIRNSGSGSRFTNIRDSQNNEEVSQSVSVSGSGVHSMNVRTGRNIEEIPHTSRNSDSRSRSTNIRAPRNVTEVPQPVRLSASGRRPTTIRAGRNIEEVSQASRDSGSGGRSINTSAFQVENFPTRPGRIRNVETENRRDRFYDNLNELIGTTQESLRENLRELATVQNSPESHGEINGFLLFLKSVMESMTAEMFKEFRLKILKLYIETVNTD